MPEQQYDANRWQQTSGSLCSRSAKLGPMSPREESASCEWPMGATSCCSARSNIVVPVAHRLPNCKAPTVSTRLLCKLCRAKAQARPRPKGAQSWSGESARSLARSLGARPANCAHSAKGCLATRGASVALGRPVCVRALVHRHSAGPAHASATCQLDGRWRRTNIKNLLTFNCLFGARFSASKACQVIVATRWTS